MKRAEEVFRVNKSTRILLGVLLAVIVLTVAAVSMNSAIDADEADMNAIETAVQEAKLLATAPDQILDETGSLDKGCLENYRAQLVGVFSYDSGYVDRYSNIMQQICENFGETTETTVENIVIQFNTERLEVDGDNATAVCDLTILRKSIQYDENMAGGSYCAVFGAAKRTLACALEKGDDGVWRVSSWEESNYQFGSPVDMKLSGTLLEQNFATREEAYAYANSLSVGDICPLLK